MTDRYELFMNSINASNDFIVKMFLFAIFVVISYQSLNWLPLQIRAIFKRLYLAFVLVMFILVTVYFWLV